MCFLFHILPLAVCHDQNQNSAGESSHKNSFCIASLKKYAYKDYLANLLETALLCQIFVFLITDFKLWLLAYFLISFNWADFQQDWTTLILEFLVNCKIKKHKRGTLIKCLISMLSNLAENLHR